MSSQDIQLGGDCRHGIPFGMVCRECQAEAVSASSSPWISVHDKLPNHLQKVLFCFLDGSGPSGWYRYPTTMRIGDFYRESPTEGSFRDDCHPVNNSHVAWWMPVPIPPGTARAEGEY